MKKAEKIKDASWATWHYWSRTYSQGNYYIPVLGFTVWTESLLWYWLLVGSMMLVAISLLLEPHEYSCLENPKDRGAWMAIVHGVTKSWRWLRWLSLHACMSENTLFFFPLIFTVIYLAVLGLCYRIRTLGCGVWNLVPWIWIRLGPPPLVVQSLSHWTLREVPKQNFIFKFFNVFFN